MKQYLLSVWHTEGDPTPSAEEMEKMFADVGAFNKEVQDAGAWVFAGGLHPANIATVVRSRGGEVTTTDGPFAETKEYLGGFWVLKAPDLDAALALSARGAEAFFQPVDVRPFQDDAEE